MKAVWRNPCSKISQEVLIGKTTFIVEGLYNDGEGETPLSGGGFTAPLKPDFEISSVAYVLHTDRGDALVDVTQLLEDVNDITWKKECSNCFFEHLSNKIIEHVSAG